MSSGLVGSSIHSGRWRSAHALDRFADVPRLVRVDHQPAVRTDDLAHERASVRVLGGVAPHLDLEARPARGERLAAERAHLLVGVAHPSGRGDVCGVALAQHLRLALGARRCVAAQDLQGLCFGQRVGQVAEVDAAHDLSGPRHDEPQTGLA
jgi:hypothetical protein